MVIPRIFSVLLQGLIYSHTDYIVKFIARLVNMKREFNDKCKVLYRGLVNFREHNLLNLFVTPVFKC
jgi:hypothetical protein